MTNVLIDFTQIPIQKVGVGVYAIKTFEYSNIKDDSIRYHVLIQDDDIELGRLFSPQQYSVIKVKSKFARIFLIRFLYEQIYIPYICHKYNIDIVHSLHYSFPLFVFGKVKRFVTIHDLSFFIFPEVHTRIKRIYFKLFISLATKFCDTIICVSESTKADLMHRFPDNKSNIYTIPLAAESKRDYSQDQINAVKNQFGITKPYLLFIGTLEPRKNIDKLVAAYHQLNIKDKLQLVIVGKKGWYYDSIFSEVAKNKLEKDVVFTGFVTTDEKNCLLASAHIFIYPSIYEGFGLPVLESINYGIPTITSNVSSMPEVAGEAAILVSPESVKSIASAINSLIDNAELRNHLIAKSKEQSSKFSWHNTARSTVLLYRTIEQMR